MGVQLMHMEKVKSSFSGTTATLKMVSCKIISHDPVNISTPCNFSVYVAFSQDTDTSVHLKVAMVIELMDYIITHSSVSMPL